MTTVTTKEAIKHHLDCIELLIQDAPEAEKQELCDEVWRFHDTVSRVQLGGEQMGR